MTIITPEALARAAENGVGIDHAQREGMAKTITTGSVTRIH